MRLLPSLLLLSSVTATTLPGHSSLSRYSPLARRDEVCSDLSVATNNGDRKVAIVIDSSGSMAYNDPYDLRLTAGKALVDFLVSNGEASGSKKADQVSVIDFDDSASVAYPLGDPGNAGSSFSKIDSSGGTYIAAGVRMAIQQLTASGTGDTDKRSAIVVFTDGEDSSTQELIDAINNATAKGIRVSFGFLDTTASSQPTKVLQAIRNSRGVYATITVAAGSINYINYVILNGLTYNDNPQGYDTQLLSGLAETHLISGSDTKTLKYNAQQGEKVNFTITTITAGSLTAVAQMNGQNLQSSTTGTRVSVVAPNGGEMQLLVTAKNAATDSLFSVLTNSNVPIKNCTVGVAGDGNSGLSTGAKAGIGVGVTAGVLGLLGVGGYFAWKHFGQSISFGSGQTTMVNGANTTMVGGGNAPMAGGGGGGGGGGGDGTMTGYFPGSEKMAPYAEVHPMNAPPGAGQSPMSYMPPGQSPMGTMPQAPMGNMPPVQAPLDAMGQAPMASLPSDGGQSLMHSVPPAGSPSASIPFAFAPPGLPPNLSKPSGQAKDGDRQAPMDEKGQQIMGPGTYQSAVPPHSGMPSPVSTDYQYPVSPNGFQAPMMSPNTTGTTEMGSFQHTMGPGGFQQPMAPGAQHIMPPPPGSQAPMAPGGQHIMPPPPGPQAPMGTDSFQHTLPPGGSQYPIGPGYQAPMGPDGFNHPMAPDGYNHPMSTGSSSQPLSPAGSQHPLISGSNTPFPTGQDHMPLTHGVDASPNPAGPGVNPIAPGSGDGTQAGFTMPGVQMRQGGKEKKHHHHAWIAPDMACEHPECPLVATNHVCSPDKETCVCTCRNPECPVLKRGLAGSTV